MWNIKLNKVIKFLIYSDLVFYTGWGLISPIFAVFILQSIAGGTALVVGLAAGINLITRSILRIPFGMMADSCEKQNRAFWMMALGLFISALVPLAYIFSSQPWHIYILQVVLGASLAMSTAAWTGIFSRHMDRGKESTEWGVDAVAVGIGPGIAGILGGIAATLISFNLVFLLVSVMGIIGVLLLFYIKKDLRMECAESSPHPRAREVRRNKKSAITH